MKLPGLKGALNACLFNSHQGAILAVAKRRPVLWKSRGKQHSDVISANTFQ